MISPRPEVGAGPTTPGAVVVAVVAPADLDAVLDALDRQGAGAVHVSDAQGRPPPGAHPTETYKGAVYRVRLAPRVRLEVVTPASAAAALMHAISAAVREPLSEGDLFAVDLLARTAPAALDTAGIGVTDADARQGDDALRP